MTPAPLTITADNQTKVYGGRAADADGQLQRLRQRRHRRQPDHAAHAAPRRPRRQPRPGGTYAITASGAVDANYTISYVAGTLTVTPAALTITADNETKVYGGSAADADGQLQRLRQRRHRRQPDHAAHAAPRRPPAASPSPAALPDHRQRRGRRQLHDQLRRRHADRHAGRPDDHGRQPDQGLRRGAARTLTASYSGFVNGDTAASLTTPPTLHDHGDSGQPGPAPTPSPPAARSMPTTRSATSPAR